MSAQAELHFKARHGGKRKGAGRPRGTRASHHRRPEFEKATPAHVTVRVRRTVWSLRSRRSYSRIGGCLDAACGRLGLRVIEYAVLGNHIHLIVEAVNSTALSRGMQGLCVRLARALNAMMGRKGPVFDDHYDSRLLRSPTQLVRAIAYVLRNHEHHFRTKGVDPYGSEALPVDARGQRLCAPETWLLRIGFQRAPPRDLARLVGTHYAPR